LRQIAASLLKDAGIPQAAVMELVGHDSKQMSAHYTHVGRQADLDPDRLSADAHLPSLLSNLDDLAQWQMHLI
jgi:integrase